MELVTSGAAIASAGGGMGATTTTMLTGMVLAADRIVGPGGPNAVMVDVRGDLAVLLGQSLDLPGLTDLVDQGEPLEAGLMELTDDVQALAAGRMPLPLLLPRGHREPTPDDVGAAVAGIIKRDWRPVVDCGTREVAIGLLDALVNPFVLSRIVVLDNTPAAAARAEAFGMTGVRLLREAQFAELTAAEFCELFPVDGVLPHMPLWDSWVADHEVPTRLVEAMAGSGDDAAMSALTAIAGLLLQPVD